ncbi:hypothetical protein CTAYLR_004973 [Chrysophaeum taylorii]|uniref:Uncharacterized protein n=1 Tax=Chrysophaeum taylorii TaxID=2483200 RepID=A0AAD7XSD8_9STRA|nr:hypothetical protein CTAYLR_004973 [Chrysophaeum taylorii]
MASRDLQLAKKAFRGRRKLGEEKAQELSRSAHDATSSSHAEKHKDDGELIKSLILGGLDGCITTFAIVSASVGASLGPKTILIMGTASVIADGLSMGLGDYISERAELEYVKREHLRESWELEHYPEGELDEMVDIYTHTWGVERSDAETILRTMVKYKQLFSAHMTHFELGLLVPDDDSVWKKGATTFASFLVFGAMPLLAYFAFALTSTVRPWILFLISIIATAVTLFALGYVKARFIIKAQGWRSGLKMLFHGGLAAAAAYLVGWAVRAAVGN